MVKEKICPKCNIKKPIVKFSFIRLSSDGHQSWCRECKKLFGKYWHKVDINIVEKYCRTCCKNRLVENFYNDHHIKMENIQVGFINIAHILMNMYFLMAVEYNVEN